MSTFFRTSKLEVRCKLTKSTQVALIMVLFLFQLKCVLGFVCSPFEKPNKIPIQQQPKHSLLTPCSLASSSHRTNESMQKILDDIKPMKARDIKKELERLGIDCSGIFEKEELVTKLAEQRANQGVAASSHTQSAVEQGVGVHIPLRVLRGSYGNPKNYICCSMTILGQKEEFIIDTGASNCIVTDQLRQKYNLQQLKDITTTGAGGGGGVFNAPVVSLPNAVVGGQSCNLQAIVLSSQSLPPGISGLLGIDFIKNFDVADFNFQKNELHLHNSADLLSQMVSEDALVKVPLIPHPLGLVCCSVELNQRGSLAAIVDMGSTFSIINKAAANQAGITQNDEGYQRSASLMTGVDGRPMPVDRANFNSARIGGTLGMELKGVNMHIGDIPGLSQVGFGNGPGGLVGLDILGGARSVFDFKNLCMFLKEAQ